MHTVESDVDFKRPAGGRKFDRVSPEKCSMDLLERTTRAPTSFRPALRDGRISSPSGPQQSESGFILDDRRSLPAMSDWKIVRRHAQPK
jgi:hypothetical protein